MSLLVARAAAHAERRAIIAPDATWTYAELLERSARVAAGLLDGAADLAEARVAFLVEPSAAHAAAQWGIWRAGGVAVPLCVSHPAPELAYAIDDAQASIVVADTAMAPRVAPLATQRGLRFVTIAPLLSGGGRGALPVVDPSRRAMLVYTSGTTSKPKGVVFSHAMLAAQIASVVEAWDWTADDRVLHVLPLHHLHGILNLLCCPLWTGATCEIQNGFDSAAVWDRLAGRDLTLFMAVPTIYTRLLATWEAAEPDRRRAFSDGCRRLRLMVSGSAALSVSLLEAWRRLSGHTLLERYGMTEIGMALGNPLRGERRAGHVGVPFPGIEVRLVDESGAAVGDDVAGQIEVRGATVFREYWRQPQATRAMFTPDGW
ncbi:MAG: AMP-binding protein, partial [Candidatus Binatia bacterium]